MCKTYKAPKSEIDIKYCVFGPVNPKQNVKKEDLPDEDEFKNVMEGFQKRLSEMDSISSNDSEYSYYDLLTTFFTDSKGNNICDILSNINSNLSELHNILKK